MTMDGHRITLSSDFLQDFALSNQATYRKTDFDLDHGGEVPCRDFELNLAKCLNKFESVITATVSSSSQVIDPFISRDFEKVLQCSKLFKEYESCVRKEDI